MSLVLQEKNDGILRLTLNRPEKMNAYNVELHNALYTAIDAGDKDNQVRVIVITGAGKAFCAGADISQGFSGAGFSENSPRINTIARDYGGILNIRSFNCDTPIIGAINGFAVGIGATMTLPWDIKILSSKGRMGFPFGRRGIVFDGVSSWLLPRILGIAKTQELILKGNIFSAQDALNYGLVSEVVEPDSVLDRAMEIARDIADNVSPTSAAHNKQLLRAAMLNDHQYGGGSYDNALMASHMAESELLEKAFVSPDCIEGVNAFLEKRAPKFQDRE